LCTIKKKNSIYISRFEKSWIDIPEFFDLFLKWWSEYHIIGDFGNEWKLKLQHIRKRLRGWNRNIIAAKHKNKKKLLTKIQELELIQDKSDLDVYDLSKLKSYHLELDKIYEEEEYYWQQRAKLKWFLEGDHNTKFFHTIASLREKNFIFSLEIDGTIERDPLILSKHVVDFYRNLMGTSLVRMLSCR
jgi:hypothetical protein